jgi:hypothetical protein
MRNNKIIVAVLTAALALTLVLAGCSKKDSSGGSGGGSASAPKASGKAAPASDFTYDATADGAGVVIKKYTGNGGKVVIPAEIEGLPVVELARESFIGESQHAPGPGANLTAVVIPASVKKIGGSAFQSCKKLTSVTFLGSGVELDGSFSFCTELAELIFPEDEKALFPYNSPSVGTGFSAMAFVNCKKLPLAMRAKLKAMGFDEP